MDTNISAPTLHIASKKGDFAKTVLLTGDPKRSEYITKNFLQNPVLVNNVRGVNGYTGFYKNKKISIMACGIGVPSIAMYAFELYSAYDVETIIFAGTAGSIQKNIKLKDIIVVRSASTNSNFANSFKLSGTIPPVASFNLLKKANTIIDKTKNNKIKFGNILTTDMFYIDTNSDLEWAKIGTLAIDMSIAGLYLIAERLKKQSLGLCTIANEIVTGKRLTSDETETKLNEMIELALEIATTQ